MKFNQIHYSIRISLAIALFVVLLSLGLEPINAQGEPPVPDWIKNINPADYMLLSNDLKSPFTIVGDISANAESKAVGVNTGHGIEQQNSAYLSASESICYDSCKNSPANIFISVLVFQTPEIAIAFCKQEYKITPGYNGLNDPRLDGGVGSSSRTGSFIQYWNIVATSYYWGRLDTSSGIADTEYKNRTALAKLWLDKVSKIKPPAEENQSQPQEQPLDVKLVAPENPTDVDVIEIEAEVSGDYKSPLSYVWYKDNVKLEGETGYKIRLESGVLPGKYHITVEVTDNERRTGAASTTLNVVEGNTGIRGDVLDVDSFEPIPDACVWVTSLTSGVIKLVNPDSAGKYSIHVLPGHYKVSAMAPSYLAESGTFGDDVKVLSPHDEPYCIDCYTTFNFRLVEEGCLLRTHNMAFKPWGAYNAKCDYFVGYVKEASEGTSYLWEKSSNKDLQANGQAAKILIDGRGDMLINGLLSKSTERTITSGNPLMLEEGYQLAIKAIDTDGNKAYLELSKNGQVVDSKVIAPSKNGATMADETYYYKADVGKTKGIVQIAVHFKNAFFGADTNIGTIDGVFQLSDSPIAL